MKTTVVIRKEGEESVKNETKVGLLFLLTIAAVVSFTWLLGFFDFLHPSYQLRIGYNFAGGIEVGSPVRAMGIKVGHVQNIEFSPGTELDSGETVNLIVTIAIRQEAWQTLGEGSRFFVNLAGIIGERFIEITPRKHPQSPSFHPGSLVRGEDPPRIDQLLSQGYGLAGKVIELIEDNESSFVEILEMANNLIHQLNRTLVLVEQMSDHQEFTVLLKNSVAISHDVRDLVSALNSDDTEVTVRLMQDLLKRLEPLDADAIRTFLQKEGVRARLF